jgi:hypothetical protein
MLLRNARDTTDILMANAGISFEKMLERKNAEDTFNNAREKK